MAEYVRRKRPPADHPYWAWLQDRARPPRPLPPVAVPATIGLFIGLWAGLSPTYTFAEAARTAVTLGGMAGGSVALLALPFLWFNTWHSTSRRERWIWVLLTGATVAACVFVVGFSLLFLFLGWYSVGSGHGPWAGMAIGLVLGAVPGALIGWLNRRNWRRRQRQGPRWDQMRAARGRSALTVTAIPAPRLANTSTEPHPPQREQGLGSSV